MPHLLPRNSSTLAATSSVKQGGARAADDQPADDGGDQPHPEGELRPAAGRRSVAALTAG